MDFESKIVIIFAPNIQNFWRLVLTVSTISKEAKEVNTVEEEQYTTI